jgi:guanine deaminase
MTQTAFRSQLLTFNGDPAQSSQAARYETDGLLIVDDGKVVAHGAHAQRADARARRDRP